MDEKFIRVNIAAVAEYGGVDEVQKCLKRLKISPGTKVSLDDIKKILPKDKMAKIVKEAKEAIASAIVRGNFTVERVLSEEGRSRDDYEAKKGEIFVAYFQKKEPSGNDKGCTGRRRRRRKE